MIEPIRKQLENAVLDLRALARDPGSVIPLWSRERWSVQTVDGSRSINLEHPIEKDYEKFLYYQLDALLQREAVKTLATSLQNHPTIQEALCLKPKEHGQELIGQYVLPITTEVIRKEDAGEQVAHAMASVLATFDTSVSDPTYTAKYYAPLRNFSCTEDDLQLLDGISIKRIPNSEMADHLNALATHTNFHDFHDLEFQLESTKQLQRVSPRLHVGFDVPNPFWEMEDAMRLIKAGAVGILFDRAQSMGSFGGQSTSVYSVGRRLYGDKNSFKYSLTKEDVPHLIKVYKALKTLRTDKRFSIALRRFVGSYPKPLGDDRVLDYWIALEALLLPDGKEGELRTKAALRLAWLLGTKANRTEMFKAVQKSYDLRSGIAHGTQKKCELENVTFLEGLVRQTMLHCLEQGKVPDADWLNALVLDVLPDNKSDS